MMNVDDEDRRRVMEDVRRRDGERFAMETVKGIHAGLDLIHGNSAKGVAVARTPQADRENGERGLGSIR